jgi:hypothetical protein
MGTDFLAASRAPSVSTFRAFLAHQSVALWGPLFIAPAIVLLLCEQAWHIGINTSVAQGQDVLYGSPFFPTQIVVALFAGWVLGGTLPHRTMLWVWVLPSIALCLAFMGVPLLPAPPAAYILFPPIRDLTITQAASLGFASRLSHFFGRGAGLQPYIQVVATLPLYSAAVYSLGAWLSADLLRTPVFFETLRNLRKRRVILFVALPWFCLKLALNWQQASAQCPALGVWPVLRAVLVMLAMATVFVAFVFSIVVGVVGRRFFLSRFFLNDVDPDKEVSG